jgi:hypothetical protein
MLSKGKLSMLYLILVDLYSFKWEPASEQINKIIEHNNKKESQHVRPNK